MKRELLQPTEQKQNSAPSKPAVESLFSESAVEKILEERRSALEDLQSTISKKLYYRLEDKIKQEQIECEELLDAHLGRKRTLSKYSLVLDPQYFEQLFISNNT